MEQGSWERRGKDEISSYGRRPIFWGSKWPRSLSSSGLLLPSRSLRTIMEQPVSSRLVLPLPWQIPEICASALTLSSRRSRSTTSLHALHPPLVSPPTPVLLCIIIVVDAKKFNGRRGMVVGYPNDLSFGKDFAAYPSFETS